MKTLTRSMILLLAVGAVLALPATSFGDTVRVRATSEKTWKPAFRAVPKGTKVVWKNPTSTKHTVTAYGNNWSKDTVIRAGERTSKTFKSRGAYTYRCKLHSTLSNGQCSGMCGHIHVD